MIFAKFRLLFFVAYYSEYQCLVNFNDAYSCTISTIIRQYISLQVLRKNFGDLMYVCTFGEDDTSEKRVVYTENNDDNILLMVRNL